MVKGEYGTICFSMAAQAKEAHLEEQYRQLCRSLGKGLNAINRIILYMHVSKIH